MKKKNDLKKLAQMGMLAGMLLSSESAFANFGGNNNENLAYFAAKCGSKCGGAVASSCGSKCNNVAERSPYDRYGSRGGCGSYSSQGSCGSRGYNYQSSCGSQGGYIQSGGHSCGGYTQSSGHSCGAAGNSSQGYYDPSKWATNDQGTQGQNNGNQGTTPQQPQTVKPGNQTPSATNASKYQASGGCGGKHGCNGGPEQGPNNGGKFQASNGCGGRAPSNNSGGSQYYNPNQVAEADKKQAPVQPTDPKMADKRNSLQNKSGTSK